MKKIEKMSVGFEDSMTEYPIVRVEYAPIVLKKGDKYEWVIEETTDKAGRKRTKKYKKFIPAKAQEIGQFTEEVTEIGFVEKHTKIDVDPDFRELVGDAMKSELVPVEVKRRVRDAEIKMKEHFEMRQGPFGYLMPLKRGKVIQDYDKFEQKLASKWEKIKDTKKAEKYEELSEKDEKNRPAYAFFKSEKIREAQKAMEKVSKIKVSLAVPDVKREVKKNTFKKEYQLGKRVRFRVNGKFQEGWITNFSSGGVTVRGVNGKIYHPPYSTPSLKLVKEKKSVAEKKSEKEVTYEDVLSLSYVPEKLRDVVKTLYFDAFSKIFDFAETTDETVGIDLFDQKNVHHLLPKISWNDYYSEEFSKWRYARLYPKFLKKIDKKAIQSMAQNQYKMAYSIPQIVASLNNGYPGNIFHDNLDTILNKLSKKHPRTGLDALLRINLYKISFKIDKDPKVDISLQPMIEELNSALGEIILSIEDIQDLASAIRRSISGERFIKTKRTNNAVDKKNLRKLLGDFRKQYSSGDYSEIEKVVDSMTQSYKKMVIEDKKRIIAGQKDVQKKEIANVMTQTILQYYQDVPPNLSKFEKILFDSKVNDMYAKTKIEKVEKDEFEAKYFVDLQKRYKEYEKSRGGKKEKRGKREKKAKRTKRTAKRGKNRTKAQVEKEYAIFEEKIYESSSSVFDYLKTILYPLIFLGKYGIGAYSNFFKQKILDGSIKIQNLEVYNLAYFLPEYVTTKNIDYPELLAFLEEDLWAFVRNVAIRFVFILSPTRRRYAIPPRPLLPPFVIKDIKDIRDNCVGGYHKGKKVSYDNLLICYNREKDIFSCHTPDDVLYSVVYEDSINEFTKKPFPDAFIGKVKKRYGKEWGF